MRPAVEQDLPRIVDIYNSTIAGRMATATTEPVTVAERRDWLLQRDADRRPVLVHEEDGEVVAWVGFEPFYGRPAYHATAEFSIYLDEAFRGGGLGRHLLEEAIELAPRLQIHTLLAFVFAHNEPSVRLFQSFGFQPWGNLPDIAEMDGAEYSLLILGKRVG